jgi:hypothetical protein
MCACAPFITVCSNDPALNQTKLSLALFASAQFLVISWCLVFQSLNLGGIVIIGLSPFIRISRFVTATAGRICQGIARCTGHLLVFILRPVLFRIRNRVAHVSSSQLPGRGVVQIESLTQVSAAGMPEVLFEHAHRQRRQESGCVPFAIGYWLLAIAKRAIGYFPRAPLSEPFDLISQGLVDVAELDPQFSLTLTVVV